MLSFAASDALSNAAMIAAEIARTGGTFVVSPSENKAEFTRTACSSSNAMAEEPPAAAPWLSQQGRVSPSSHEEDDSSSDSDDDEERRVAKSRERNREHARKTRLRKKAQLEALQSRVKGLRAEAEVLKQSLEECSLASILICLSQNKKQDQITDSLLNVAENSKAETCTKEADEIVQLVGGKRKRFASPDAEDGKSVSSQPLKLRVNGKISYIGGGGRSHINWKTGVYSDDHGVQKQLTQNQLESLRRERNRMHAKMTRDRKKNFIATIEKTIEELESNNKRMKGILARVVNTHFHNPTTSTTQEPHRFSPVTPECTSVKASLESVPPLEEDFLPSSSIKRTRLV